VGQLKQISDTNLMKLEKEDKIPDGILDAIRKIRTSSEPQVVSVVIKLSWTDNVDISNARVIGSWNNWNTDSSIQLEKTETDWSRHIDIMPGRYEYRFLIDGEWRTSSFLPISAVNPKNNTIEIPVHSVPLFLDSYTRNNYLDRVEFDISLIPINFHTQILLMAIDVVGQLLCLPQVAQNYVLQDRNNIDEELPISSEETETAISHFKNHPIKLGSRDLGTELAGTNAKEVKPTIFLNYSLLIGPINPTLIVRNFMLLVATILHEISHWKIRYNTVRFTPEKLLSESGFYTELNLFGGCIFPGLPLDSQGKYLNHHLIFRSNEKDYFINDEWIINVCLKLVNGEHIILDDVKPLGDALYIPRVITRPTNPPIKCTIHQERIEMGLIPQKLKFLENNYFSNSWK